MGNLTIITPVDIFDQYYREYIFPANIVGWTWAGHGLGFWKGRRFGLNRRGAIAGLEKKVSPFLLSPSPGWRKGGKLLGIFDRFFFHTPSASHFGG
jgi:hypothetical protein